MINNKDEMETHPITSIHTCYLIHNHFISTFNAFKYFPLTIDCIHSSFVEDEVDDDPTYYYYY
jgi:hypothetical protein